MSRERTSGLVIAGKFFGFLLFLVGLVLIYNTWIGMDAMKHFSGLFFFWGIVLSVAGFFMLFVKIER